MKYDIIDILKLFENTVITVNDKLKNIKNDDIIKDERNNRYKILSIGMLNNLDYTTMLIEGKYRGKQVII